MIFSTIGILASMASSTSLAQAAMSSSISNTHPDVPINSILTGGNLILAAGNNGFIYSSQDLVHWNSSSEAMPQNTRSLAENSNGIFVAVGSKGQVVKSNDGIHWEKSNSGVTADLYGVSTYNDRFVAVGDLGTIITSTDGINWIKAYGINPSKPLSAIAVDKNGNFVAVSRNGAIYTSTNGISWTLLPSSFQDEKFLGVAADKNGNFVAVGSSVIVTSKSGWRKSGYSPSGIILTSITVDDNNKFVAVGTEGVVLVSEDGGLSWIEKSSGSFFPLLGVAYSSSYSMFIAFGGPSWDIFASNDGYSWGIYKSIKQINRFSLDGFDAKIIDQNENKITVVLPAYEVDLTKLVATFGATGNVTVNGISQRSGVTANDYTKPVIYTVHGHDGSTKNYTISVNLEENAKDMTEFAIDGYRGTFNGNSIEVKVPQKHHLSAKATFNGSNIFIDGKRQISNKTENDFSNPVTYELRDTKYNLIKKYTVVVDHSLDQDSVPGFHSIIRDNDLYFNFNSDEIESIIVSYDHSWVPADQKADVGFDINRIEGTGNNKTLHLRFRSGRKGSSNIADQFKKLIPPPANVYWWMSRYLITAISSQGSSSSEGPKKLNFLIKVQFNVIGKNKKLYTISPVYIGQGHQGFANNWWIGYGAWEGVCWTYGLVSVREFQFNLFPNNHDINLYMSTAHFSHSTYQLSTNRQINTICQTP